MGDTGGREPKGVRVYGGFRAVVTSGQGYTVRTRSIHCNVKHLARIDAIVPVA